MINIDHQRFICNYLEHINSKYGKMLANENHITKAINVFKIKQIIKKPIKVRIFDYFIEDIFSYFAYSKNAILISNYKELSSWTKNNNLNLNLNTNDLISTKLYVYVNNTLYVPIVGCYETKNNLVFSSIPTKTKLKESFKNDKESTLSKLKNFFMPSDDELALLIYNMMQSEI